MLDPVLFRGQLDDIAVRLKTRGIDLPVNELRAQEEERKKIQTETQELQNLLDSRSKAIGLAKSKGEDVSELMAKYTPGY